MFSRKSCGSDPVSEIAKKEFFYKYKLFKVECYLWLQARSLTLTNITTTKSSNDLVNITLKLQISDAVVQESSVGEKEFKWK